LTADGKVRKMVKIYEVELKGITPLLMNSNRMVGRKDGTIRRTGEAVKGNPEEWKEKMYFKEGIGLYLPSLNIEIAFYQTSKGIKIGGREYAGKYFNGAIYIDEPEVQLLVKGEPVLNVEDALKNNPRSVYVDTRIACLKTGAKKTSQLRYRLCVGDWSIKFKLIDASDGMIITDKMVEVIEKAGMVSGLLDWRPRFGRFKLESIKEVA